MPAVSTVTAREGAPQLFADDVHVALAPGDAYQRLIEHAHGVSWRGTFRRPVLVLLVIGVACGIAATGRATVSLVASGMVLWSWVILVQIAAGLLIISTSRTRRASIPSALDLLFVGHLPWSLWVCAAAAWAASDAPFMAPVHVVTALIALPWTVHILYAFTRTVLAATPKDALVRTLAHQGLTWAVALWFAASTSGGWYRLVNP